MPKAARALLDAHGLQDVRVEQVPGSLTDHYDGEERALRLSEVVARERSVAALGIAGHEVSHAYQDAEGNRAYRARHSIGEQLAQVAPWSGFFLLGGFWFGVPLLIVLSLVFVGGLVLFALATLPVEVGASRRALMLLQQTRLADEDEVRGVRRVLTAAGPDLRRGSARQARLLPLRAVPRRGRTPRRHVRSRRARRPPANARWKRATS